MRDRTPAERADVRFALCARDERTYRIGGGVLTEPLDYPDTDDVHWRVVTRLQLGSTAGIVFHTDPVKEPATSSMRGVRAATR